MTRRIQFSVPRPALVEDHLYGDGRERAFLEAVADEGAGVELFDPFPYSRDIKYAKRLLDRVCLSIDTIHGDHLQQLLEEDRGRSILLTRLRAAHLASTIDRVPDESVTPSVSTHHFPRLWPDGNLDAETARRRALTEFVAGVDAAEPDPDRADLEEAFDGSLITATVAFENVARKTGHEYLLVTPDDVRALRATAASMGMESRLAFTLDVAHADDPAVMLSAMHRVVNVHLHGKLATDSDEWDTVREQYDLGQSTTVGYEDEPGVLHHLPPQVGDPDLQTVFDALDDRGYEGPLTIELHEAFRTPAVVHETVEELREYV